MTYTPTKIETERRNRTQLSLYAYAYEFENDSLVDDGKFDALAKTINPNIETGNKVLDQFFQTSFNPDTGQWIHQHPELEKIKSLYNRLYGDM